MTEVYAVFRQGVYRHECGGVFDTLHRAKECADFLADEDVDGYHTYVVVPFRLNQMPSIVGNGGAIHSPKIGEADPEYEAIKGDKQDERNVKEGE